MATGNELIPYYKPGKDVTAKATGVITGKRFVSISGNRTSGPGLSATDEGSVYQIAQSVAAVKAFGVAATDAAVGDLITVVRGGIVPVTAGGTIAAGAEVEIDATGRAVTLAAGKAMGICCTGVTVGLDAEIALY